MYDQLKKDQEITGQKINSSVLLGFLQIFSMQMILQEHQKKYGTVLCRFYHARQLLVIVVEMQEF